MHRAFGLWRRGLTRTVGILIVLCAFALPISTTVTDLLFPVTAVLSFFSMPSKPGQQLLAHPVALIFIGFFALSLIGATYSIAPLYDLTWHGLFKTSCFFFAALLMISLNNSPWRRYAVNAFLLAMTITLFLSYFKYYAEPDFFRSRFDQGSVFKDHIIQNFLMAYAVFILIHRWLSAKKLRWIYGLLILLMVHNVLFISSGRSGYVIFSALLLYTFCIYAGWRGIFISFVALTALGILAFSFSTEFKQRLIGTAHEIRQYQQDNSLTSMGIRIQSLKNALLLIEQKPLLGHGTGSFATAYAHLPQTITQDTGILQTAYNSFINLGVELGFVGLGFIILLFGVQWRFSFQLTDEWRPLTQMLIIGMVLGCMANAWLSDTTELHLFTLLSGLGFSTVRWRYQEPALNRGLAGISDITYGG